MTPIVQALHFIISTFFDLYIFVLLLRFLFQIVRADYYNPISQLVVKITNPPLVPLRRLIPGLWGIDMACLILCLFVSLLKLIILFALQVGRFPDLLGLILWSLGDLTRMTIYVFFFAILVQVILSWVSPYGNHPLQSILYKLTTPIMRPFKRIIPPVGGFDISPIFAIILLQVLIILIAAPIAQQGFKLALS